MNKDCDNCKFANYSAFDYPCNNCSGAEQWQEGTYDEPEESETCQWKLEIANEGDVYHTSCGNAQIFICCNVE